MVGDADYHKFVGVLTKELHERGWGGDENFADLGNLAVRRTDTASLVTTQRVMIVRRGDGLSKDDVVTLVTEAHRRITGTPPLFPATCTIVFVFSSSTPMAWVVQRTQTGSLMNSTFAAAWAVVLPEKKLAIHQGTPYFRRGASAVRAALAAL